MPIYEYECENCSHRFELRQGFNDKPVETCPLCQGNVKRILSPVPIIFKGSGFYSTDNRAKNSLQPEPGMDKAKFEEAKESADKILKKDKGIK